ncbi:MAG: type II secretion system protein [Bacilli bacterium]|nr:type II secretion system protein [Bacilli bacterium]
MKKAKKGFTVVELVVTIALVGILAATTAITITATVRIQSEASEKTATAREMDEAVTRIKEVVSYFSVQNDVCDFQFSGCTGTEVTFTNNADSASYTLGFAEKSLYLSNDYGGENRYFQYSFTLSYSHIEKIDFSYDSSLQLLTTILRPLNGSPSTHVYSLEVLR